MRGELHGALLTGEWFASGEGIHGFFLVCFTLITNITVLWIRTRIRIRTDPHSFLLAGSGSGSALGIRIRIQGCQNDP
jgi:hypothetical protein